MATVIIMPKQGQSVESCIITEFHKKKGDKVKKGDLLFAYETDKASFEEESPVDGVLLEAFFEEGDEVPVLTNVCVIGEEGEETEKFRPGGEASNSIDKQAVEEDGVNEQSVEEGEEKEIAEPEVESKPAKEISLEHESSISPRAKNLAERKGIPVGGLLGSGPHGRIIERDIEAALTKAERATPLARKMMEAESLSAEEGTGLAGMITSKDLSAVNPVYGLDYELKPLSNIRKIIAKAMYESLQNSAQLTHHLGADARRILELRKKVKAAMDEGYPTNITLNDMICFAAIKTLKQFPQVNAHFMGDSVKIFNKIHLGLAVDTERGLMVPVVKNADDLSITGLANQFKEIANASRKGAIDPELLASEAASFTVTNLGAYGVEMFTPVINLPQVAILGVNTIVPRPKDLGDGVYGFVPYLGLSLTYDHRALDGGEATRFLKQLAIEIENLEFEL